MNILKDVFESILAALFPNRCLSCEELIDDGEYFCDFCYEMLPQTAEDKLCSICGRIKKDCQCKYRVFHFSGFTAPYYYESSAKKAMHNLKFNHKRNYSKFFAKEMSKSVRCNFNDKKFNAITYVPMPYKKQLKRGYNQSRELAVEMAKILNLPLVENALGCNPFKKVQHETKYEDRFKNVKGMFYPNVSLRGRTVLLVDDIKTSGATLDECSKALLKAGANEVYCVTGLVTRRKKNKKR